MQLAYLHQREARGLPAAIDIAYPWVDERIVALTLPDTIIRPQNAMDCIIRELKNGDVDIMLGVFPTDTPEDLCPVAFDNKYRVTQYLDKVNGVDIYNTWGMAAWTPPFNKFMHAFIMDNIYLRQKEITLTEIFIAAQKENFRIRCQFFEKGVFFDIGKNTSLIKAIRALELPALTGC